MRLADNPQKRAIFKECYEAITLGELFCRQSQNIEAMEFSPPVAIATGRFYRYLERIWFYCNSFHGINRIHVFAINSFQ
jgi:hypothetical protein